MASEKKRFWICFDLGFRGEYDNLYAWLDRHHAKECGDGVATFVAASSRGKIARELEGVLGKETKARIYLIEHHRGGKFVFGKRKVAPWTGYAQISMDSGEEN